MEPLAVIISVVIVHPGRGGEVSEVLTKTNDLEAMAGAHWRGVHLADVGGLIAGTPKRMGDRPEPLTQIETVALFGT